VRWDEFHTTAKEATEPSSGAKTKLSGQWAPDRELANYVAQHPD
jgi:hypothetical protein